MTPDASTPDGTEQRSARTAARRGEDYRQFEWYTPSKRRATIYEDVTTLPEWDTPDLVTMVDLDLDVIRLKTGEVEVHDEDEFEQHRLTYNYPAPICELALRTCAQIRAGQVSDVEPYASVGWRWLERAIADCA